MNTNILLAAALLLAATDARAYLSSSIKEHQDVLDEVRDVNAQIKSSLDATKALQGFNTGIYSLRTGVVSMMQAQAAMANCMVNYPALYQQDDPSASKTAQTRGEAQEKPLQKTAKKLEAGHRKIQSEAQPLAEQIRSEDVTARGMIGGKGSPSGQRADQLIGDLEKATRRGLETNRKGEASRRATVEAGKASENAAKLESQAADKNDQISGQLNQICSQIKALPKDPMSLPASIASAMAMAAQGAGMHAGGMPPLTQAATAIAQAQKALKTAQEEAKTFEEAIPGKARPESADLPYVTKANDVRTRLEKRYAEVKKTTPQPTDSGPGDQPQDDQPQ